MITLTDTAIEVFILGKLLLIFHSEYCFYILPAVKLDIHGRDLMEYRICNLLKAWQRRELPLCFQNKCFRDSFYKYLKSHVFKVTIILATFKSNILITRIGKFN